MNAIDHAVDVYVGELARRGLTKATRTKYQEILFKFCWEVGDLSCDEITPSHCRAFLDRWVNASRSTIALHVTILKRFFEFLLDEGAIEESPMAKIRRPTRPRPEDLDVVTISTADVNRLFAACREWDEVLCLALVAYLGPRRSAIARLRRRDVDLERGTIRFLEKGRKVITKPMPDELHAILKAADEDGEWLSGEDYIVKNRRPPRNAERSAKVVYRIVTDVAKRARVRAHPHAIRAAFAVRFLETHEGDLKALQNLLGHARIETTDVYLRRFSKQRSMERVRDLSWGSVFPSSAGVPPAGFEPALGDYALPEPIRRKLDELRARNPRLVRDRS